MKASETSTHVTQTTTNSRITNLLGGHPAGTGEPINEERNTNVGFSLAHGYHVASAAVPAAGGAESRIVDSVLAACHRIKYSTVEHS